MIKEIQEWYARLNADEKYLFDERAGMREFDGGMDREDAEKEAQRDVLKARQQQ